MKKRYYDKEGIIYVKLKPKTDQGKFIKVLDSLKLPEGAKINRIMSLMIGSFDLIILVSASDIETIEEFVISSLRQNPYVLDTQTVIGLIVKSYE
ncbi:MAG: Lrp/AsnC ligand binding domain-containing protein [candidate division Zixibacteria bacterium]|nr:Lrp/AsnC ligand binding domain-containing protein [candidate division Zixibacteria bacterium]